MKRKKIYTKDELIALIDKIGYNNGREIEVTGQNGGENLTIVIAQTEWYDTPVYFVGGYGNPIAAIGRDEIAEKLPGVLDDYFDRDSVFMVNGFYDECTAGATPEDEIRIEVCECCGGRNIAPEPYDDWSLRTWCPDCEDEHYTTNLKEYKATIDTWWDSLDDATTELLSREAENRRAWWRSLTFDQQRELYKKVFWDEDMTNYNE